MHLLLTLQWLLHQPPRRRLASNAAGKSSSARSRRCTLCPLHQTRTQAVFGVGNRNAQLMVIGEAPGADEDRQGEPFVGRAGQLLNSMLKAIGLPREQVFIANILKSRPPNNRDPRPEEVRALHPVPVPADRAGESPADPVRRAHRCTNPAGDRYDDR